MVGLKNFSIVLDSPSGSFYAGTIVSGRVLLFIEKPKTVRSLNVKIEGVAKVSWTEREDVKKADGETRTETVHFNSEEEYFSNKFKLLGGGSGDTEIPIGDHVYPFSCTLPQLLPSSFEGEHGSVKYSIKAVMDRPWKTDHEAKLFFNVVTPLDLNYSAQAKEPVRMEQEKTFCCFCCKSGPLQLVLSLPYHGYVSGQAIPLAIEVDNASNIEVDEVKCKLMKEVKYTAHSPRRKEKSDKIEVSKLKLEGVGINGSKSWTQQLSVPVMPFVNLDACSIIKESFFLQVAAKVSGPHSNLSIEVPIIIGSVPIGQLPGTTITPPTEVGPNYNVDNASGWGSQPTYPDAPPLQPSLYHKQDEASLPLYSATTPNFGPPGTQASLPPYSGPPAYPPTYGLENISYVQPPPSAPPAIGFNVDNIKP